MYMITDRIAVSGDICNGKPIIKGKRITVQTILEYLKEGDSVESILEQYPALEKEDIIACMDFAVKSAGNTFSIMEYA